jgi:hypothetical protein
MVEVERESWETELALEKDGEEMVGEAVVFIVARKAVEGDAGEGAEK